MMMSILITIIIIIIIIIIMTMTMTMTMIMMKGKRKTMKMKMKMKMSDDDDDDDGNDDDNNDDERDANENGDADEDDENDEKKSHVANESDRKYNHYNVLANGSMNGGHKDTAKKHSRDQHHSKTNHKASQRLKMAMTEYDASLQKYSTFETVHRECLHELKQSYKVTKTIDLITSPGCVILQGTIDDMTRDMNIIRQFENAHDRNGLYEYF
ncbi:phosphatidylinositol transfer protein [Reticulomyxa filosa]|uniref:Phosphatidylinositol transfer protein n=1 Tax=Reticulomyxa filosa TaxID=46433 RepID=X6N403_RETFI|nr:phosphatidylinositol transfer protein [Reticulomyxa filosa]|eukprot:ETO20643.1 phosphatidylinositol transfer protein [Reticulomyxa filosa]